MSYYDFDDHFWGAWEVCTQSVELEAGKEPSFASRIISTIFAAFTDREVDRSHALVNALQEDSDSDSV